MDKHKRRKKNSSQIYRPRQKEKGKERVRKVKKKIRFHEICLCQLQMKINFHMIYLETH